MLDLVKNRFSWVCSYGQNEKGIALMTTLAISLILMALGITYYMKNTMEVRLVVRGAKEAQSFYTAEAGTNWGLRELQLINTANGNLDYDWIETVETPAGTAYVAYRREDLTPGDLTDDLYHKRHGFLYTTTLNAQTNKQERTIVVEIRVVMPPAPFNAATLSGPNGSGGGFVIDGRDHKMVVQNETEDGWIPSIDTPNNGTLGIITDAGGFNRGGSSSIGGTTEGDPGVDVEPTTSRWPDGEDPGWDTVVDLDRADLKHSPDDVLLYTTTGYAKQRAIDSGTYYLNPHLSFAPVDYNMTLEDGKIYYLEFDVDEEVTFSGLDITMADPTSVAILVIHHTCQDDPNCRNDEDPSTPEDNSNPGYKVETKLMSGLFKGVLIADQVDKIHGTIVGSLVTIGAARKSIGNGNGGVYYSLDVTSQVAVDAGQELEVDTMRWEEDNSKDVTMGIF